MTRRIDSINGVALPPLNLRVVREDWKLLDDMVSAGDAKNRSAAARKIFAAFRNMMSHDELMLKTVVELFANPLELGLWLEYRNRVMLLGDEEKETFAARMAASWWLASESLGLELDIKKIQSGFLAVARKDFAIPVSGQGSQKAAGKPTLLDDQVVLKQRSGKSLAEMFNRLTKEEREKFQSELYAFGKTDTAEKTQEASEVKNY